MLSGLWTKIVANSYVIGAGLLAVLGFFARFQFIKNARDKAEVEADTLKAVVHANKIKREIKKEEEIDLLRRSRDIKEEIKKLEKGEESEGIDNLTNPNDY